MKLTLTALLVLLTQMHPAFADFDCNASGFLDEYDTEVMLESRYEDSRAKGRFFDGEFNDNFDILLSHSQTLTPDSPDANFLIEEYLMDSDITLGALSTAEVSRIRRIKLVTDHLRFPLQGQAGFADFHLVDGSMIRFFVTSSDFNARCETPAPAR